MKNFATFLAGLFTAILGASIISLLAGNNIALQFGGEGNTIRQTTAPQPEKAPAPAPHNTSQYQSPAPSQAPSATTTQPPPNVTGGDTTTTHPANAPSQTTNTSQSRSYRRSHTARNVEDCSCPVDEVSAGEADDEDTADEAEDCDCEEGEPPAA